MTIVIAYSSTWFSANVSDRLTTVNSVQHDAQANKVLVLRLNGGLITIAYTGPAYIAGAPTDEWIAKQLVPGQADLNGLAFQVPNVPQTLREVISRLVVALRARMSGVTELWQYGIEIGISGIESYRGYNWPLMLLIYKSARSRTLTFSKMPIKESGLRPFYLWVSGEWGERRPDIYGPLFQALRHVNPSLTDAPEQVAQIMENAARQWAIDEPTIGDETMTVLHTPTRGSSNISYKGEGKILSGVMADVFGPLKIRFTPWIIGSTTVVSPLEVTQDQTSEVGGWPIKIEGGNHETGMYISFQSREPPPR